MQVIPSSSLAFAVIPTTSQIDRTVPKLPVNLQDLLDSSRVEPARKLSQLKAACSALCAFFGKTPEEITLDSVAEFLPEFRDFLRSRKYTKNTVQKYSFLVATLVDSARSMGWNPLDGLPAIWRPVLELSISKQCYPLALWLARRVGVPSEVTADNLDSWRKEMEAEGRTYDFVRSRCRLLLNILESFGIKVQLPQRYLLRSNYRVHFDSFPLPLKDEVSELLRWKQADFTIDRPKEARIRPVSALRLLRMFEYLYGFATTVLKKEVNSIEMLVKKTIVSGWIEWSINERKVQGNAIINRLGGLNAALNQHPDFNGLAADWLKALINAVPETPSSDIRARKAKKFLPYSEAELIPAQIKAKRLEAEALGSKTVASQMVSELLVRWVLVLPWRQRNLRECRIGGSSPNLFKAKIPPLSEISKPKRVVDAEAVDPEATFWQFRFSPDETKTGISIHALLPRQLIDPLEEYLTKYRPGLVKRTDPGLLFLNSKGRPLTEKVLGYTVSRQMLLYGGVRVTPHAFRDIVAYAWLEAHPGDYLSLSKMLWHRNIQTTIGIYGARFNESNGVRAMEEWIDKRTQLAA